MAEEETAQSPEQISPQPESVVSPEILPTPAKSKKPWLKIILFSALGVLVFGGAIFGAYKFGQRKVQPGPTPVVVATPTPDPTANWKTYTNTEYGYSIKYPDFLTQTSRSYKGIGGQVIVEEWATQWKGFVISIFLYQEGVDPKLESNLPLKLPFKFKPEETVLIEGQEVKKLASEDDILIQVGPIKNGKINYSITLASWIRKTGFEEFNLMLSTFKFLPSESSEITPSPSPTPSLRKISYRNIPGWPLYKSLLDFDFQYPPDYSLPQKNVVDFMNLGQFYCSFPSSKKVGTGLDYLNFIALPKNYEEKIQRTLKILNAPGYLKKEEVEVYSYPAVLLDLDQSYKHYQKDQALVVETGSMLLIVNYKQDEINKNWDYILESIRFGSNFNKDYFEEKLNECRG